MDESVISQVRTQFQLMGNLAPIVDEVLRECLPKYFDCNLFIEALGTVTVQIPWQMIGMFKKEPVYLKDLPELSFNSPNDTHIKIYPMNTYCLGKTPKKLKTYEVDLLVLVKGVCLNFTLSTEYSSVQIYKSLGPFRTILYSEICTRTSALVGEYKGDLGLQVCGRTIFRGSDAYHIAINYKFTDRIDVTQSESIEIVNRTYLKQMIDYFL